MKRPVSAFAKNCVIIFGLFVFSATLKAQYVVIPDTAFVTWLQGNGFGSCMNGNQLDTTCEAILISTSIDCRYLPIRDLTGIQYFKNIRSLICQNDSIAFIPSLPDSLIFINCSANLLHSLPPLPPVLQNLTCGVNPLGTLPALPATLGALDCLSDSLTSLPALPGGLISLTCQSNFLHSLPHLPGSLKWLYCPNNLLDSLPELPNGLTTLYCWGNALTYLPQLPDSMSYFDCGNNPQLMCLPTLKTIVNFSFTGTAVTCLPDYGNVTQSTPALNSFPLCTAGNANGCSVFTGISEPSDNTINLKFHPNPATDKLYIEYPVQDPMIYVCDLTGRIWAVSLVAKEINISFLTPGIYYLQIQTTNGTAFAKFVRD